MLEKLFLQNPRRSGIAEMALAVARVAVSFDPFSYVRFTLALWQLGGGDPHRLERRGG